MCLTVLGFLVLEFCVCDGLCCVCELFEGLHFVGGCYTRFVRLF